MTDIDEIVGEIIHLTETACDGFAHQGRRKEGEDKIAQLKAQLERMSSGMDPVVVERLMKAAAAVKDEVCGLLCPSHWKAGKRPPHHPKCVELRAALSSAIDECSCADLRASGGIAGAP